MLPFGCSYNYVTASQHVVASYLKLQAMYKTFKLEDKPQSYDFEIASSGDYIFGYQRRYLRCSRHPKVVFDRNAYFFMCHDKQLREWVGFVSGFVSTQLWMTAPISY